MINCCVLWSTDHVQELVREWIDLVTERDRLLREELQQVSNIISRGPCLPLGCGY